MTQGKLVLLALVLLVLPVGMVAAQSSSSYVMQRFVMVGGSSAESASFSVTSVIGQSATDVVNSSNYKVSGGFLQPLLSLLQESPSNEKIWLPLVLR